MVSSFGAVSGAACLVVGEATGKRFARWNIFRRNGARMGGEDGGVPQALCANMAVGKSPPDPRTCAAHRALVSACAAP